MQGPDVGLEREEALPDGHGLDGVRPPPCAATAFHPRDADGDEADEPDDGDDQHPASERHPEAYEDVARSVEPRLRRRIHSINDLRHDAKRSR